jgi:hypothetical protein
MLFSSPPYAASENPGMMARFRENGRLIAYFSRNDGASRADSAMVKSELDDRPQSDNGRILEMPPGRCPEGIRGASTGTADELDIRLNRQTGLNFVLVDGRQEPF